MSLGLRLRNVWIPVWSPPLPLNPTAKSTKPHHETHCETQHEPHCKHNENSTKNHGENRKPHVVNYIVNCCEPHHEPHCKALWTHHKIASKSKVLNPNPQKIRIFFSLWKNWNWMVKEREALEERIEILSHDVESENLGNIAIVHV